MNRDQSTASRETGPPAPETELDLKAVREAKNLALKDIFQATRITTANLEAIEEGRFHLLPEPVYTRHFIKAYAAYLGVDATPALNLYASYLQSVHKIPSPGDALEKQAAVRQAPFKKDHNRVRTGAFVVFVVCVLAFFYLIFSNSATLLQTGTPPASRTDTPALPQGGSAAPAGTDTGAVPAAPPAQANPEQTTDPQPPGARTETEAAAGEMKGYRLTIKAVEKTWLKIQEDQKRPQEWLLLEGDVIERFAVSSFALVIGNAGGIEASFQGQPLGPLGGKGQVVHLQLP